MERHVKVLGWFNVVIGVLGLLIGLAFLAGGTVIAEFAGVAASDSDIPAAAIQIVAIVILGVLVTLSLPCLFLGYGLLHLRPWARILGIVLAALNLLNVPIGTAISLYAFWVLLQPETEALFQSRTAPS